MIALAIFVIVVLAAGERLSTWLWRREVRLGRIAPLDAVSRAASAMLFGFAVWIALNWALSPIHAVRPVPLLVTSVATLALCLRLAHGARVEPRARSEAAPHQGAGPLLVVAVSLAATSLLLWMIFVLWRGIVMPPLTHDALAYHLPKAVYLSRAHGYATFGAPDARIDGLPSNYELMLADILLFDGSDRITEWLGTLTWGFFLLTGAAVAERWWGRGWHLLAVVLALASVPIVLLHSGADKNDLVASAFFLQAMLWGSIWAARESLAAAISTIVALMLGFGTKPHGGLVAIAVLLPVIVGSIRRKRLCAARHPLPILAAIVFVVFPLLGGASYVNAILFSRGPLGQIAMSSDKAGYGEWANLLWFPPLVLTAPFSSHPLEVWVPWRDEYWFWPRYELYFSHFGALFTVLVVAVPPLAWLVRRSARKMHDPLVTQEMIGVIVSCAFAVGLIVLIRYTPFGFFSAFPRYILFLPAVLIAWAIPALIFLTGRVRRIGDSAPALVIIALIVWFGSSAVDYGRHDRFAPLAAVLAMARGTMYPRAVPFAVRGEVVVDSLAGPDDHIALDGAMDSWVQPLFGRELRRQVDFIAPGPGPVEIPTDATWVVTDRVFKQAWLHPEFANLGQWRRYLGRGPLDADDRRIFEYCRSHPDDWDLVFSDEASATTAFRRKAR